MMVTFFAMVRYRYVLSFKYAVTYFDSKYNIHQLNPWLKYYYPNPKQIQKKLNNFWGVLIELWQYFIAKISPKFIKSNQNKCGIWSHALTQRSTCWIS